MKVIDPKSLGLWVHFSALETKLTSSGMKVIVNKSEEEKIDWKDKPMIKLIISLTENLKDNLTITEYFSKFDSNHDGFLSQSELFLSLKSLASKMLLEDY